MDALSTVTAWILSLMVMASPPGGKVYYPEAQETEAEARERYESIAKDVAEVVYDPQVKPLFKGADGRARTVSVVLSIMKHESSFMKNVDYNLGKYARGDSGKSWCSMQILIGNGRTKAWNTVFDRPAMPKDPEDQIQQGYTGEEMIANRKLCISEGLKIIKQSFYACGNVPIQERLRSYASGSCEKGLKASKDRMNTALFFYSKFKRDFKEEDVVSQVADLHKAGPFLRVIQPTENVL